MRYLAALGLVFMLGCDDPVVNKQSKFELELKKQQMELEVKQLEFKNKKLDIIAELCREGLKTGKPTTCNFKDL